MTLKYYISAAFPVEGIAKHTFVFICLSVSVKKIDELGSLALILLCAPCNAGKKVECIKAGFKLPILGATSLVILKYGSYSNNKILKIINMCLNIF